MGKSSPPAPPSPQATAQAQMQVNQQSALQQSELNNVNQITPFGSLTYQQTGNYGDGTPQYTATTSLNEPEQNLLNMELTGGQSLGGSALNLLGNIANTTGQPLNISGQPGLSSSAWGSAGASNPGVTTNVSLGPIQTSLNGAGSPGAIQQAENAAYGMQTQYLDPQYQQEQAQLENQLANQGITQGSQAYNTAMQNFGLQKNQAYGNAAMQAVQAGQNEQNTLFGQALQGGQFSNAAQAQGFSEGQSNAALQNATQNQLFNQGLSQAQLQNAAQQQYLQQQMALANQPLNQYNALMTGAQVQQPNFVNTPQSAVAPTNYGSIVNQGYQNQLAQYNAQQQGMNNLFGLGGNLAAAAILA